MINHIAMHCLAPQLPFGGVGASGWAPTTASGVRGPQPPAGVLAKPNKPDLSLMYPPHTDRAIKIMRKLM